MSSLKGNSKINKDVEKCVKDISKLPYNTNVIYKAARRYNDRIYVKKKCQKTKK
jgi:hypothetical protein